MTYQVAGIDKLDDWMDAHDEDDQRRLPLLDWLARIAEDPDAVDAEIVYGTGLPTRTTLVPGTQTAVTFVVVKSPPYPADQARMTLVRITDL